MTTNNAEQTEGARRLNMLINKKGLAPANLCRALDIRDGDGTVDIAKLLGMGHGVIEIPDAVLKGLRKIYDKYTFPAQPR